MYAYTHSVVNCLPEIQDETLLHEGKKGHYGWEMKPHVRKRKKKLFALLKHYWKKLWHHSEKQCQNLWSTILQHAENQDFWTFLPNFTLNNTYSPFCIWYHFLQNLTFVVLHYKESSVVIPFTVYYWEQHSGKPSVELQATLSELWLSWNA